MKRSLTFAAIALSFLTLTPVFAEAPQMQQQIAIGDDQYVAGGNVTLGTDLPTDLIAAGGNVTLSGRVGRDLLVAGGQLDITSPIGDDLRAAGGTIRIASSVAGDVLVTGGSVVIAKNAVINGDVAIFAGTLIMDGQVKGKLTIAGGDVTVSGQVAGPADIKAETFMLTGVIGGRAKIAAQQIGLGPDARLRSGIDYWTEDGQMDFTTALAGGTGTAVYKPELKLIDRNEARTGATAALGAFAGVMGMFSLLSAALFLTLLMLFAPNMLAESGRKLMKSPGMSLLTGVLFYFLTPLLILGLFLTIIGIPLGFFGLFVYVFSVIFGSAVSAAVIAQWIEQYFKKKWHPALMILLAVAVFVGLKGLWLVPVLGWICRTLLIFMAVGALLMTLWTRGKKIA